jgi:hypothetical protein
MSEPNILPAVNFYSCSTTSPETWNLIQGNIFDNFALAEQAVNSYAETEFTLVRSKSQEHRVVLACQKYRKPKSSELEDDLPNQDRSNTGCKACFHFRFNNKYKGWKLSTIITDHNHPLYPNLVRASALSSDEARLAIEMKRSGCGVPAIRDFILQRRLETGKIGIFVAKDLHNFFSRKLPRPSPDEDMLVMFNLLQQHSTQVVTDVDSSNRMTKIVFTFQYGLKMMKEFGDIILFDSTFKTNRFNFNAILFIGIDSNYKTFVLGGAIVDEETAECYDFVLSTLRTMLGEQCAHKIRVVVTDQAVSVSRESLHHAFPFGKHILCRWHVMKNIRDNLKSRIDALGENCWTRFVDLIETWIYNEDLDVAQAAYEKAIQEFPVAAGYMVYKKTRESLIIDAHLKNHPHYKTRTTGRSESFNHVFKRKFPCCFCCYSCCDSCCDIKSSFIVQLIHIGLSFSQ